MKMRLLDTNIVSYWMRGDRTVIHRLMPCRPCDVAISAVTLAEILYGIEKSSVKKSQRRKKIENICAQLEVLEFDAQVARQYAVTRASLEKIGMPISERDLQIAATALTHDLSVVTHNTSEFDRIEGLTVEDWART